MDDAIFQNQYLGFFQKRAPEVETPVFKAKIPKPYQDIKTYDM